MSRILFVLFLLAVSGAPMWSQPAAVMVRIEAGPQAPIAGAIVGLVDAADRALGEVLSPASGRVTLSAPPGEYRVRVRRIGYRPFYSEIVSVPRDTPLELRVESPRVVLSAMVVSARSACGGVGRDATALSTAWEEIAKALRSTQLTPEDKAVLGESIMYRNEINASGKTIRSDSTRRPPARGRPFVAVNDSTLMRHGYARGDIRSGWEYYAPDEAILLSNSFAETHCFRIVRDRRRAGEIGVAFEPIPRRRLPEIAGTLWLDAASSELREIVFRYVNVKDIENFDPGGFTRFSRLPSGAWYVSEWRLRWPVVEINGSFAHVVKAGYVENGGRVLPARRTR